MEDLLEIFVGPPAGWDMAKIAFCGSSTGILSLLLTNQAFRRPNGFRSFTTTKSGRIEDLHNFLRANLPAIATPISVEKIIHGRHPSGSIADFGFSPSFLAMDIIDRLAILEKAVGYYAVDGRLAEITIYDLLRMDLSWED